MSQILSYKFKYPYLVTIHNTYITVTKNHINKNVKINKKRRVNPQNPKYLTPPEKIDISIRNKKILQLGYGHIWKTFLTLTFSPEYYIDDTKELQKYFRAFIKHLYYIKNKKTFKYLAVLEYGELNNRVHYHILTDIDINDEIFDYNQRPDRKVCWHWKNGYSDVVEVSQEYNAVHYMMKYIQKPDGERTPIGKREVFHSHGLYKAVKIETYNPDLFIDRDIWVEMPIKRIQGVSKTGKKFDFPSSSKVYFQKSNIKHKKKNKIKKISNKQKKELIKIRTKELEKKIFDNKHLHSVKNKNNIQLIIFSK